MAFLPGGLPVTGTIELASGEMVAGAGRLAYGGFQLLLLTAGIVAGAAVAGRRGWGSCCSGSRRRSASPRPLGALPWLMVVLFGAWLGQLAGDRLIGPNGSGFVGALAMTPAQVTFLPAFWLPAPGAVGLTGVTESVANPEESGMANLAPPLASILAIALGVLCGTAIHSGLTAALRHR